MIVNCPSCVVLNHFARTSCCWYVTFNWQVSSGPHGPIFMILSKEAIFEYSQVVVLPISLIEVEAKIRMTPMVSQPLLKSESLHSVFLG